MEALFYNTVYNSHWLIIIIIINQQQQQQKNTIFCSSNTRL